MVVTMALFWGLVVVASIWVLYSLTTESIPHGGTAVDVLDRRLARSRFPR